MKKLLEVIFDFMVVFFVKSIIVLLGEMAGKNLAASQGVWIVSILIGLLFAEFFTISKKK